ncbi:MULTISPECIES: hypothetical protein [Persicobacter]|uniref:Uncharacterized protein n=1 Tax=Persicobacter diffluens TaxID=981 RepID=A0AAN5AMA8_9BACT|nr:hypothetical protein [Persicobacter sp. CCB-QB2]GJM61693.1 hypothetical protein PEDI_22450 [Persicobacter diffluens]
MEIEFTHHLGNFIMVLFLGLPAFALGALGQALFLHHFAPGTRILQILSIIFSSRIIALLFTFLLYSLLFSQLEMLIGKVLIPALLAEILVSPALLLLKGYDIGKLFSNNHH